MKEKHDNSFAWNDAIQKMSDEGMFRENINQEDKLKTVLSMLNSIEIDGLAMEECTIGELMDYILEIKRDIQNVIDFIDKDGKL